MNEPSESMSGTDPSVDRVVNVSVGRGIGSSRLGMMAALAAFGAGYLPESRHREPPPEKPCLNCGKLKQHNNSYCSAECCREHRQRSR